MHRKVNLIEKNSIKQVNIEMDYSEMSRIKNFLTFNATNNNNEKKTS